MSGEPTDQPAYAEETIVADTLTDDESLGLDDNASSSASIASSILNYRYENGRRYHAYKAGSYVLPNDDTENDRLELQHHMFRIMYDDKLYLCPADPEKLQYVLDAGTGTGVWASDIADEQPHAQVVGVDLSPIQPSFVPPNVRFYVDDVEDEWTYSYKFDLIYARMLTGSLSDWPKFFKQSYEALQPGGYIELSDIIFPMESDDDTLSKDSALYQWGDLCKQAAEKLNRPLDSARKYSKQLAEAGFTNITEKRFKWPQNHWPKHSKYKQLGIWTYEDIGKNIHGLSAALFTRGLEWSPEDLETFLIEVRKQMKDPRIHAYFPIWVVYAQKPASAS